MTAFSESLKMNFRHYVAQFGLDEQTISKIFFEEMRSYRNEIVHLEAAWKFHPAWHRVSNRDDDLGIFQALWKGLTDEGIGASLDWDFVEKYFSEFDYDTRCRVRNLLREHRDLPEALRLTAKERLQQVGVPSNGLNMPLAVDVIVRARSEAARRVKENVGFDDLAKQEPALPSFVTAMAPSCAKPAGPNSNLAQPILPFSNLNEEQQRYAVMTPAQFADEFIKERFGGLEQRVGNKRKREIVEESTLRDIRWVAVLLEKVVPRGTPFSMITLEDVTELDRWFDLLPTTIGKSPKDRSPQTTFEMIRERALDRIERGELSADQIGLSINTSNKHWQNFARMHEHLRSVVPGLAELSVAKFITPQTKNEREARDAYTKDQGEAIFSLPPWTGCADLNDRLKVGKEIIHDALFFILLLVWYTGARREEICKLKLDDIFDKEDHGIPYIFIRPTDTGRIKCKSSKRKIPIHDELIRLGFVKYVEALRAEGETLLFPEMYPSSRTKRKIGDVFYKIWWIYIRPLVPDLLPGQAMHAARHTVSDALKQSGIDLEHRNDYLGHSQKGLGEGASTYSEPTALQRMKEMVEKIPKVTGHLQDVRAINLLPPELRIPRPSRQS